MIILEPTFFKGVPEHKSQRLSTISLAKVGTSEAGERTFKFEHAAGVPYSLRYLSVGSCAGAPRPRRRRRPKTKVETAKGGRERLSRSDLISTHQLSTHVNWRAMLLFTTLNKVGYRVR